MMTKEDVLCMVRAVEAEAFDAETAHGLEDSLYTDVLAAIRDGECDDPAACAGAALTAQKLEFPRWYA